MLRSRWGLVAALAISSTVGYGVLFYAFAVFLTPITADLHTSPAAVTGAVTVSTLVMAAVAVPVGKWLDHRGGRTLMTAGALIAFAAVAAWSRVDSIPELYAVFALIGLASAMTLYGPAFAVLVRHLPTERHASALLAVTIVAGLATSVFTPLTGWLTEEFGWRRALLLLAVVLLAVTLPLHLLVVPRGAGHHPTTVPVTAQQRARIVADARRDPAFWLLAAAFMANGVAITVVPIHLVSFLISVGHPAAFAAAIAGLLGVLSVTGRIVTTGFRRRMPTALVAAAVFALQAVAIAAMPAVGGSTWGAVTCVALFGLGFGVSTLTRPALLTERYGTAAFGTLTGTLQLPLELVKAGTPVAAAAVATLGHYGLVMAGVAVCCLVSAACLTLLHRHPVPQPALP
ncbi:putative MFS family arabinose efflux permease [Allocatelliglobosispora scoriae]|uniref:Putative MFS family arabinose efflux permease n=1 Tax=Allocatelliglobosispora scoriae TaxID=643052 RepID=A0A841BH94_9ACTN|nr:MFS transporter [Allocatelliglobosispora scoriae]MBB5867005.1 putative MFS family arabinose efflux permease [Allocatelliglobosispora scoriae]